MNNKEKNVAKAMSNKEKNGENVTKITNTPMGKLAEENGWRYIKQLYDSGFQFLGGDDAKSCKNMFVAGFLTCSSVLAGKLKEVLTEVVTYEVPDDPYMCCERVRVLSDEQINEIINKVFN